jgi:abhydrolase domain-containing protein 6
MPDNTTEHADHTVSWQVRVGAAIRRFAQNATRRSGGIRSRQVDVNGLIVGYDERGERGERGDAGLAPILLLHGFSADREVWTRFARHLPGHRLLIPDMAGHGHTPFVAGAGYSAPDQADRLVGFLDALGIDRVHVIGNSMGGFIAATLALRAPERVISLGLVDAAGVDSTEPSELGRQLRQGVNPFLLDDASQFDAFYALTMAKPPFVPGIVRAAIAEEYVARRPRLSEIWGDFHAHDLLEEQLAEITAPTWIAWGRRDQIIDVSAARVYADGLPHASLTIYDDLGHMPMFEAPRRTAQDYAAFLAKLPASAH